MFFSAPLGPAGHRHCCPTSPMHVQQLFEPRPPHVRRSTLHRSRRLPSPPSPSLVGEAEAAFSAPAPQAPTNNSSEVGVGLQRMPKEQICTNHRIMEGGRAITEEFPMIKGKISIEYWFCVWLPDGLPKHTYDFCALLLCFLVHVFLFQQRRCHSSAILVYLASQWRPSWAKIWIRSVVPPFHPYLIVARIFSLDLLEKEKTLRLVV